MVRIIVSFNSLVISTIDETMSVGERDREERDREESDREERDQDLREEREKFLRELNPSLVSYFGVIS